MGMIGGIEGFTVDEEMTLMTEDLDIDWETGDLDPDEVNAGKRRELNTMMEMGSLRRLTRRMSTSSGHGFRRDGRTSSKTARCHVGTWLESFAAWT